MDNKRKKKVRKLKGEDKAHKQQVERDIKGKLNDADISDKEAKISNHSRFGDPNWYFTDKELAEQSSRFSFQSFIGNGIAVSRAALPSICTIYLNPSLGSYVGFADSNLDASLDFMKDPAITSVNLMARKLYSRLSNKSGRTQSYAPQDVMTLILAMGEVISISAHLKRILGLAFTYNYRNRDFPRQIIRSLGVDADDFLANLGVYRVKFNTVMNIANKIPFPGNISWFAKCAALYEGVFKDSPDDMAQIYAFVPGNTWVIDEDDYEGGTILKTVQAGKPTLLPTPVIQTFDQWLTLLKSQIDALLTSSTYNVIFGDILNMADSQGVPLLHLNIVPEDYSVIPEYNSEILLHIHNLNMYNPVGETNIESDPDDNGITKSRLNDVFPDPDTNNLLYSPLLQLVGSKNMDGIDAVGFTYSDDLNIVDFPYGNPDLTERIEATRFSSRIGYVGSNGEGEDYVGYPIALPDHYATSVTIWNGGSIITALAANYAPTSSGLLNYANIAAFEKFRYAPILYRASAGSGVDQVYGDLNYFTQLDGKWMKRINDLCTQGLFELR